MQKWYIVKKGDRHGKRVFDDFIKDGMDKGHVKDCHDVDIPEGGIAVTATRWWHYRLTKKLFSKDIVVS